MPAAIPLRRDFDANSLRRLAGRCRDNRQIRRLLALAAVYDGLNRTEAARLLGRAFLRLERRPSIWIILRRRCSARAAGITGYLRLGLMSPVAPG